ncbi:MAG TPA: polyphenol oxidase family protein [Solirubrobacterales bacterium]|nr:polyphenol oxidase family protein [Solirubrobacterales bacterium]
MEWRETDGVRWLAAELGAAGSGVGCAGFGSRVGGISEAPYDTLNIGVLTDDADEAVLENRRRLAAAVGIDPHDVPIGLQVHRADIAVHGGRQEPGRYAEPGSALEEVDGHVVRGPGLAPLVLTADCLPVALAGPGGVAMLHCGWRGLAAGIVVRGAEMVGASSAAIGPGIGPCCYEVGPEVLEAFSGLGEGIADGRMLDLPEVARRLLARAGVERVESAGLCTSCHPELFFSHRRDRGVTGRMGNLAWIGPSAEES